MTAAIGFGIVTRHRSDYLRDCLQSIQVSVRQARIAVPVPVAVLDNSDDDLTRDLVSSAAASWPDLRILYGRTRATDSVLATGRNACAVALDAAIVAFVDDDVVLSETWVRACLDALSDPTVAAVTGRIVEPGTLLLDQDADLPIGRILADGRMADNYYLRRHTPVEVDVVRGCNWACRFDVFRAVGGFSARFEHIYEEGDLTLRMRRAGHRISFVPGVDVIHRCGPRAHRLRQEDPSLYFERTYALAKFYTMMLAGNLGVVDRRTLRFLFTRETGLRALMAAPSLANAREVGVRLMGRLAGLIRTVTLPRQPMVAASVSWTPV
jgi:GT2 family glycosyltransferase